MNRKTKQIVYNILDTDEYAREDDLYLTMKVIEKMLNYNYGTAFGVILQGMKYNGISFESITRHRRKWIELHPGIEIKATEKRQDEELAYHMEYARR